MSGQRGTSRRQGLKRDGYEVIYMTDPVDEYAVQFLKDTAGQCILRRFSPFRIIASACPRTVQLWVHAALL